VDKESAGESTTAAPALIPQPTVAPAVNQQPAPYQQPMQPLVNIPGFITVPAPDMSGLSNNVITKPIEILYESPLKSGQLAVPIVSGEFQQEDGSRFKPVETAVDGMTGSMLHVEEPTADAPLPDVAPPPAPVQNVDVLISRPELDKFLARAAKIVRDKLPKGGLKDAEASQGVKNYLLKGSGKSGFRFISSTVFEMLLAALEAGTPEDAAVIVRSAK
jgi:hypothetical protein